MVNVTVTGQIGAPIDKVWAVMGDFDGIKCWYPLALNCRTRGAGIDMFSDVEFADWSAQEQLVELDPVATTLGYAVTDSTRPAISGARPRMKLSTVDVGRTCLEWSLSVGLVTGDAASTESMFRDLYQKECAINVRRLVFHPFDLYTWCGQANFVEEYW